MSENLVLKYIQLLKPSCLRNRYSFKTSTKHETHLNGQINSMSMVLDNCILIKLLVELKRKIE
jgi:hypothetical protein